MKNIIIGTAGHIDHGKTSLIQALTGTDTDRLKEEKKRGITIELGFAYLPLPSGERAGMIDVPGHEKFVKNMLAGVGGIDMVLLVIAADEGIMPQTQEHLDILSILHIKKGIIVLTKSDLVEEEWLEMVQEEVRDHVSETFLNDAPIIPVSVKTGLGLERLKETIFDMTDHMTQKDIHAAHRIPIDRVFSADGFGTIITGTQVEGTLRVNDVIEIYPSGLEAKVKNIQVHGKSVEASYAGQRVAVNLSGVKKSDIQRGHVLAKPGTMNVSMLLDIKLNLLSHIPRDLTNRARIRFYHGTTEVLGRIVLLEGDQLSEGEKGYAQLRLEEQVAVKTGDYFVIRYYSPVETIGGGVVLDSNPYKHKRFKPDVLEVLHIKEKGDLEEVLEQTIKKFSFKLVDVSFIAMQVGKEKQALEESLAHLAQAQKIVEIAPETFVHEDYLKDLEKFITGTLLRYHEENPLKTGMLKEEFRNKLKQRHTGKFTDHLINHFVTRNLISDHNNQIAQADYQLAFTPQQMALQATIERAYLEGGFTPPMADDLIQAQIDKKLANQMLHSMTDRGVIIRLDQNLYFHRDVFLEGLNQVKNFLSERGEMTLAEARDLLGTSRKYALPFLETLDKQKVTQKNGDVRVLIS